VQDALNQSQPTNLLQPIQIQHQQVEITAFQEEVKEVSNEDSVMSDQSQPIEPAEDVKLV
jgi:hypothetical protein